MAIDPIMFNSQVRSLGGLNPIANPEPLGQGPVKLGGPEATADGKPFSEILKDAVSQVNDLHAQADDSIRKLATGESTNIHGTLLDLQKAEMSMRTLIAVRSKVISAYEEVMRMQV